MRALGGERGYYCLEVADLANFVGGGGGGGGRHLLAACGRWSLRL